MAKRAAKRSGYETYVSYYKKYAANAAMKEEMHTEAGWAALKRDAKRAGISTVNFSRTLASRQRIASGLQLRVTWETTKKRLADVREEIEKQKDLIARSIQEERKAQGKRRYSQKNLAKHVEVLIRQVLPDDISFLEEYKDLTFREFKFKQKEVLEKAKSTVETRELWNEAFEIVYEDIKK